MSLGLCCKETHPPSANRALELLYCKLSLLNITAVDKTKLQLYSADPVFCLQRFFSFMKYGRVSFQKVMISVVGFGIRMTLKNRYSILCPSLEIARLVGIGIH